MNLQDWSAPVAQLIKHVPPVRMWPHLSGCQRCSCIVGNVVTRLLRGRKLNSVLQS